MQHVLKISQQFIFKLTLLIILLVSESAVASSFERGILWQVSKPGGKVSHVLGTIHSDDARVTKLPQAVTEAFNNSSSFTAEMDMDMSAMLQAHMQMSLPADKELKTLIGSKRYQQCVSILEKYGLPEMIANRYKIWAVAVLMSMPKPQSGQFLDMLLYEKAKSQGKKVYGLETAEEQMSVFENLTKQQQIKMLDQAIDDHATLSSKINTLIELYLKRDLSGMKRFSDKEMGKADPSLTEVINKSLIVDRNYRMVERMQTQLQNGAAFIAVGSLHLPGDKGILNLLQQRGYKIKPVY